MSNSIRFFFLILISIGIHITAFAQEETSKIKRLSQEADVIVTGKVTEKESSWNKSKTRIYTRTIIEVDESLKGTNNQISVEVISPGGEVGEVGELYSHMPRFSDDEEVLLFLKKNENNKDYKVLNGEEGKITVYRDSGSDKKITGSRALLKDLKSQIRTYLIEK
jgi:hypothetical protein